jgi:hypothetical protein
MRRLGLDADVPTCTGIHIKAHSNSVLAAQGSAVKQHRWQEGRQKGRKDFCTFPRAHKYTDKQQKIADTKEDIKRHT